MTADAPFSPRPIVRFGGRDEEAVQASLLRLELKDQPGGLSSLELHMINLGSNEDGGAGLLFEDDAIVQLGAELYLGMGDAAEPFSMFRGIVTAIEEVYGRGGPPEIIVCAEDALQRARMKRRTRVLTDTSVTDIARDLADDLGLTPRFTGMDQNIGTQVQLGESDLAFLQRLVHRYDGDLQIIEDELHLMPCSGRRRGDIDLDVSNDFRSARFLADLAHQVTQVTASGHDVARGERTGVTSAPSDLGAGRGQSGAQWCNRAIGVRSEHMGDLITLDETEAQAIADAAHARRARRFVTLDATVGGDPRIRVGARLNITGVSSRFRNTYTVTRTRHRFDRSGGYETDLEAECAYLGEP